MGLNVVFKCMAYCGRVLVIISDNDKKISIIQINSSKSVIYPTYQRVIQTFQVGCAVLITVINTLN